MKTINYNKKLALVAVAAFGVACFATGAQAGETPVGAGSRAVHYADLNLNTAVGAKVLYQRIHTAAEQVCGDSGSKELARIAAAKACMDQAIVSSVRAVNNVQLSRTADAHGYQVQHTFTVASAR